MTVMEVLHEHKQFLKVSIPSTTRTSLLHRAAVRWFPCAGWPMKPPQTSAWFFYLPLHINLDKYSKLHVLVSNWLSTGLHHRCKRLPQARAEIGAKLEANGILLHETFPSKQKGLFTFASTFIQLFDIEMVKVVVGALRRLIDILNAWIRLWHFLSFWVRTSLIWNLGGVVADVLKCRTESD